MKKPRVLSKFAQGFFLICSLQNILCRMFFLFDFILTGSIFVSPCRNDSSSPLVHKLFCSVVARPAKAAQIEDAAKVEGGYIRNFSSEKQ